VTKIPEGDPGYEPVVTADLQGICDRLLASGATGADALKALLEVSPPPPETMQSGSEPSFMLARPRSDRRSKNFRRHRGS
jgi:hypothetical protein